MLPAGGHCVPMPALGLRVPPRTPHSLRWRAGSPEAVVARAVGLGLGLDVAAGAEDVVAGALAASRTDEGSAFVTVTVTAGPAGPGPREAFLEAGRRLRHPVVDLALLPGAPFGAAAAAAAAPRGGPSQADVGDLDFDPSPAPDPRQVHAWVDAWRELLALRDEGRIRVVGTAGAEAVDLALLMDSTGEAPAVNQIELHPYRARRDLRGFHAQHGIATAALRPLATGAVLLHEPTVHRVALAMGASPAQVVLAWQWLHGDAVVSTATRPRQLLDQVASLDLRLSPEHVALLDGLDGGTPAPGPTGRPVPRRRRALRRPSAALRRFMSPRR